MLAFVFPGQGAQYVGMGKEIAENFSVARHTFEEASDAVNMNMQNLCFHGPTEELVKTENTQPAILTTSVAIMKVLENEGLNCDITAGLSLGEYTSLVKSKVLEFSDAVKIVKNRGKYMQEAVPLGKGTMAAILGLDRERVEKLVAEINQGGVVDIANFNSPGQIVISGEVESINKAVVRAKEIGAKKAVVLPVSAPFHSRMLIPAGKKLRRDLMKCSLGDPETVVITNVHASPLKGKTDVIESLVEQVSSSVLWQDSIELMINDGTSSFVEIGPGKALSSFIKRIARNMNKEVKTCNVDDVNSLKELMKNFN
ncbi:MAG: [acyl-carrier-protein] S-malonyltransferase [Alkaliphilus sp.]|jgi:[acyl-carrier-protein] S-malonyltransferase|nr:MAG: [acyl-carrier-protein] S-malonyltransferase [Alkaliphilus sp.]